MRFGMLLNVSACTPSCQEPPPKDQQKVRMKIEKNLKRIQMHSKFRWTDFKFFSNSFRLVVERLGVHAIMPRASAERSAKTPNENRQKFKANPNAFQISLNFFQILSKFVSPCCWTSRRARHHAKSLRRKISRKSEWNREKSKPNRNAF